MLRIDVIFQRYNDAIGLQLKFLVFSSRYSLPRSAPTLLRHGPRRHYPRLRLLQELPVLPHIVCNRDRCCLGDDSKRAEDMEEKDEPVNRDIDQRDDRRPADTKEEQEPQDGYCYGDVETHLRDALHAASDAGIPDAGEVVERDAHDGDAEDDVQVNQNRRATGGHSEKELE